MSNRRDFLKLAAGASQAAALPGARAAGVRPNILIVMTDQQRAGLTRGTGFPLDTMPAVDGLAARGVGFDRAYCTAPLCCPSRVSLLTGRWPHAHRVRENGGVRAAFFEKDLFQVVREMDYRVALAGKNHTYVQPDRFDFCRTYGHGGGWKAPDAPAVFAAYDKWLSGLHSHISLDPTPFPLEAQLPHRIVSDAAEFLDGAGNQPFLLWVSFPEPHGPYQAPRPYYDLFPPEQVPERPAGPEVLDRKGFKWRWLRDAMEDRHPGYDGHWRRTKSVYLGMMRLIDDQVARLLGHLEKRKLAENTIVVFVSDHGDYFADYGLMRKGVEMPEALVRIPMVWSGWGIAGGRPNHAAHVSMADVMPTLCEALGTPVPRGAQGRSLWPLLRGESYPEEEFRSVYAEVGFGGLHYTAADNPPFRVAHRKSGDGPVSLDSLNSCTQSGYMKMVRMGRWKLLYDMMGAGQLYDLEADPHELNNLFGTSAAAEHEARLLRELLAWNIRTEDNLPTASYDAKWPSRNWYSPHRGR